MLSRKMRFRRLVLSVALLVVIITVLKIIQPEDSGKMQLKQEPFGVEACDTCQSDGTRCTSTDCRCCGCATNK